jgi:hypothetical protein
VIKINRHTGDIMWRFGGRNSDFPLTAGQVFMRQHDPTLIDSNQTLMLLDNGDSAIRPVSRILEFKIDENARTVNAFKSYKIPKPYVFAMGSVQKVNGNYYICGGSSNYFIKVDSETGEKKADMQGNYPSYRAYLVNDVTGIPLNKP